MKLLTKYISDTNKFCFIEKNVLTKFSIKIFLDHNARPKEIEENIYNEIVNLYKLKPTNIQLLEKNLIPVLDKINKNFSEIFPLYKFTEEQINCIPEKNDSNDDDIDNFNPLLFLGSLPFSPNKKFKKKKIKITKENLKKSKKKKIKIINADFMTSLNILLRSTDNIFMPYREIKFVGELIQRELYTFNMTEFNKIFLNLYETGENNEFNIK